MTKTYNPKLGDVNRYENARYHNKDLAEKIILLLSDKQLREKIINNGRALVAEKYNWNIIANEFAKIYERI